MAIGRIPAPPVALPSIDDEAHAIADWLKSSEGPQRRPEATAKILALIVRLHLDNTKWPTRQQVHEHLGVSLPMIDVVLSNRQATKHITIWTRTTEGSIAKHASVVTERHIQPAQELIDVVISSLRGITLVQAKMAPKRSRLRPRSATVGAKLPKG